MSLIQALNPRTPAIRIGPDVPLFSVYIDCEDCVSDDLGLESSLAMSLCLPGLPQTLYATFRFHDSAGLYVIKCSSNCELLINGIKQEEHSSAMLSSGDILVLGSARYTYIVAPTHEATINRFLDYRPDTAILDMEEIRRWYFFLGLSAPSFVPSGSGLLIKYVLLQSGGLPESGSSESLILEHKLDSTSTEKLATVGHCAFVGLRGASECLRELDPSSSPSYEAFLANNETLPVIPTLLDSVLAKLRRGPSCVWQRLYSKLLLLLLPANLRPAAHAAQHIDAIAKTLSSLRGTDIVPEFISSLFLVLVKQALTQEVAKDAMQIFQNAASLVEWKCRRSLGEASQSPARPQPSSWSPLTQRVMDRNEGMLRVLYNSYVILARAAEAMPCSAFLRFMDDFGVTAYSSRESLEGLFQDAAEPASATKPLFMSPTRAFAGKIKRPSRPRTRASPSITFEKFRWLLLLLSAELEMRFDVGIFSICNTRWPDLFADESITSEHQQSMALWTKVARKLFD